MSNKKKQLRATCRQQKISICADTHITLHNCLLLLVCTREITKKKVFRQHTAQKKHLSILGDKLAFKQIYVERKTDFVCT